VSTAAFVGIARNCGHALPRLLQTIEAVGTDLRDWTYVFLESDSYDDTLDVLRQFDIKHQCGFVRSYGTLRKRYPARCDRLAFLRNACLRLLEDSGGLDRFDHCVVLDMDDVNHDLDSERLLQLLSEGGDDWGGLFANQSERYYDIWALRHPEWSPDDCHARVRNRPQGMSEREATRRFIEARMIRVPPEAERIEVESAFGGLGVYKSAFLKGCSYSGRDQNGEAVCEHVPFNAHVRANGGTLFVEPSLINGRGDRQHKASWARRAEFWLKSQSRKLKGDEAAETSNAP
jgi:hypothetical protein